MSDCFICVKNQALRLKGSPSFKSFANVSHIVKSKLVAKASINADKNQQLSLIKSNIVVRGGIREQSRTIHNLKALDNGSSRIKSWLQVRGVINSKISSGPSKFENKYVDKLSGYLKQISSIQDFASVQKLYPISDKVTSLNNSYFVNKNLSSGNLYDSIDEGLFTGNYNEHLNRSYRITDDNASFIQPSSIFTSGTFRYKCEVNRPYHHPKNSFLFIRAAAPTSNYGANVPPEYRIHNIKLEDPSGNIIVQYKNITLKGDADYSSDVVNYATYISEPEVNNANLNSWDANYPILSEASGYTLNMDFDIICLDDPFDQGFNLGYEERACELKFVNTGNNDHLAIDGAPLSTHTQGYHLNPTNTIRISAIEICNSGDLCSSCSVSGIKLDNYFNFYTEIPSVGRRLSKTIYPVDMLLYNDNVNIYPEEYSLWESSPDYDLNVAYNTSVSGSRTLVSRLRNTSNVEYIKLNQNALTTDSGRLTLKFSIEEPQPFPALRFGAFDFSSSAEFDRAINTGVTPVDEFFTIDSIELKVVAKKASGSRNYSFDVVGYSDDKILNVTPKVGAFLQNSNIGLGNIPISSGFKGANDLGLSSESLSDKSAYYEDYLTSVDAGDHYLLSSLPVVDSEEFVEYTIPLSIYEDRVDIGKSIDYSMSSYFENLYIDLYPIPSGASISSIRLVVNYKPSNGMMLHTLGTPNNKKLAQRDITLLPIGWSGVALNSIAQNGPTSIISGIPQSYGEPLTLKTNYARRWRGVDGSIVNGPYDPNQFDFSFYNPQADNPFLYGYFNLNHSSGSWIISDNYSSSGYYSGSDNILKNIGWRFKNQQLFQDRVTPYTTIDWTNTNSSIFGKIADAFDSVLAISGTNNINFGNLPLTSGFAIYLRFTPGIDYNLDSGENILISKYGSELELQVGFDNEANLFIKYHDVIDDELVTQVGSTYDSFSYPLSILLAYDYSPSGTINLYVKNEDSLDDLISISSASLVSDTGNLIFGYDPNSGSNSNIFIHEIGISTSGNIVQSNPNRLLKQTTAESFLSGHSHGFSSQTKEKFKLHNYIDEDTSSWKLGDFKICAFSPDFDGFTKRIGKDYIVHHLKHHGSGYSQITNLPLPSSVNASGLAYHTQIENDFLRFNLQDIPDVNPEFYSTLPRICKTLPRDYDFAERAFVVDTIIEHETNNNILWPDGSVGPKLIVSLYSKNQDPVDRPSKVNWGLINRSIHYLPPSGCYEKISSTFNHNDLIDISEPWALFDLEHARSEFDQKYYSTDIDDMFLQYDLVYPSGSPFESKIKIHSANVKLEDALVYWADSSGQMNLYASGEAISFTDVNLYTAGLDYLSNSGLILYTSGSPWNTDFNNLTLCVSGIYGTPYNQFNLFVKNSGEISELGPDLYVLAGSPRDEQSISLVMIDNTIDQTKYQSLDLYVNGQGIIEYNNTLPLFMVDSYSAIEFGRRSSMSLVTFNTQAIVYNSSNNVNLYINTDVDYVDTSGSFNLFVLNYAPRQAGITRYPVISWNVKDLGIAIDPIIDSGVPFLSANDEIRGVELDCFGGCDNSTCEEKPTIVHDIEYFANESCIEGGIFRAKNVYTNLEASGFNTNIGYSGHFYGIRKYDGLIPNAPYNVILTNKTGDIIPIDLPPQFMEIDYGSNQYVNYSGIKLAADKGLDESERQAGNKYGKSVAVKNDLIAVGAPFQTLSYQEYDSSGNLITINLDDAGAVFLYRREPQPTGYSWPENKHKGNWLLEEKLILPSGLVKDYATIVPTNNIGGILLPENITQRFWNVGQEGREFGHSVAIGVDENRNSFQEEKREIIVVGGPSAKWNRDFEDLNASGVSIGLIVFTDEFLPSFPIPNSRPRTYLDVIKAIQNKDLVFSYFCDPPVKFNVKLIICEPISDNSNTTSLDFAEPRPDFIFKRRIPRNQGIAGNELGIFSGIKSVFEEAFPYDPSKINNNIPVMLGVYVDNSRSLGQQAVNPGLNQFLSYYQQYSFASGLRDFYNTQSSGVVYEYDSSNANSEDWIDLSITAFNELLDTGRIVESNQTRFFASGLGPENFNINLSSFNYPPASGGRVYIFEKESGSWNLIQEIKSPVDSLTEYDRFGHAVAISDNTDIIAIGSPYINDACKVYQYNPQEKQRLFSGLYSWLNYENSILGGNSTRYLNLINDYEQWLEEYGSAYANEILYSSLTTTEKFKARDYLKIEEYENIFTYGYNNIPYQGKYWTFIANTFAPSSRLGYSISVNDDGSTIAIGAPTDSFNIFDDLNVYGGDYEGRGYSDPLNIDGLNGSIRPSWKSNVNAGAVRLLESRDYYPHNKVVEYGKFGNLQQSLGDPLDSGHFNYLNNIFNDKSFVKMAENEVAIPEDAGLAFIITPGVDAVSDEVITNIINWLALGDRNLVLVGNDPEWENSGIYNISNNVINKILTRLNSRMKLYPARSLEDSLPSGGSFVVPSFRPDFGTNSYIQSSRMNTAYGVGDIRINFPGVNQVLSCSDEDPVNNMCQLPLVDKGDLRAQWYGYCFKGDPPRLQTYPINWAYKLRTFIPTQCLEEDKEFFDDTINFPNGDPVPLLVAATQKQLTKVFPAIPAIYSNVPIVEQESTAFIGQPIIEFDDSNAQVSPTFVWSSDASGYISYESNINNIIDNNNWFTPNKIGDRQPIIQSKASSLEEIVVGSKIVADIGSYCVEENYISNNTSKIIAIAGIETESEFALYKSGFNDNNINFYANLVSKTIFGESNIAQLGSWTGRTSFIDAYERSVLKEVFLNTRNSVFENVTQLSSLYDVCWIANPLSIPNAEQLDQIKSWLNSGNKKLIITHDNTVERLLIVSTIMNLLGSNIEPLYLPVKDKYATINAFNLSINQSHPISNGFDKYDIETFYTNLTFTPFSINNSVQALAFFSQNITDDTLINATFMKINTGVDKISFPAVAGSGYKIYVNYTSENNTEILPIDIYFANVSKQPELPFPTGPTYSVSIQEKLSEQPFFIDQVGHSMRLESPMLNVINTQSFNAQVINGKSTIDIHINSLVPRISNYEFLPKTVRVLSISGVPIPINSTPTTSITTYDKIVGYQQVLTSEAIPERSEVITVTGPIQSLNNKYCYGEDCSEYDWDNKPIADGPVVAAQEIEFITNNLAGVERSRITVLADSNLIQGRYMVDEFGRLSVSTVNFIRSLYPPTVFPLQNSGKQYINISKLVAPERGSPQKYFALKNNGGSNINFGSKPFTGSLFSKFSDKESLYDPSYVIRPEREPWGSITDTKIIEEIKKEKIEEFISNEINSNGGTPLFSGIIDGQTYLDTGLNGGLPQLFRDKGFDYLDLFISGYPGDLFGYSVALHKNKLVVGSPFAAFSDENINNWIYYYETNGQSGIDLSYNGGAGAAYVFEKTFNGAGPRNTKTPWEFIQKLRPKQINVAIINNETTDQFGYSVSIDSDIICIGAPGHDFGNKTENIYDSGNFIRKEFNQAFDIPDRIVVDLGDQESRDIFGSGQVITNNGAIFTFENNIGDWLSKNKNWSLIEKLVPDSGNRIANDYFGRSTSIHRSFRSDADYVIVGGADNHPYSSSGTNLNLGAGAAFTHDIMLRELPPAIPNPSSYIDAKVFGERGQNGYPTIRLITANTPENTQFFNSGIIYTNQLGAIFLEVSGQDPSPRGFIQHRPYVFSVEGKYVEGTNINDNMSLFIDGTSIMSENMNIYVTSTTGNVYNNLGLYSSSIVDFGSGILSFYTDCPDPTMVASGLSLSVSGIGFNSDQLNMRIRGY